MLAAWPEDALTCDKAKSLPWEAPTELASSWERDRASSSVIGWALRSAKRAFARFGRETLQFLEGFRDGGVLSVLPIFSVLARAWTENKEG